MKSAVAFFTLLFLIGYSWRAGGIVQAADPPSEWFKTEISLTMHYDEQYIHAMGFWQSTSTNKDKQLVSPIAVKISCDREKKICTEADAIVQSGILQPELIEYEVSSWNRLNILADNTDTCTRHSLAIDFKSNSITVTDYPIKTNDPSCKSFHEANSFALHGGQLMLYPTAPWHPLEKTEEKK